jgi:hypothetical protein
MVKRARLCRRQRVQIFWDGGVYRMGLGLQRSCFSFTDPKEQPGPSGSPKPG